MSDGPIDRVDRPRDEGVDVSRIGEEKKEKEKYHHLPEEKSKKILLATFFSYLKKTFDSFASSKKLTGNIVDKHTIIERLSHLKKILQTLEKEDLSRSSEYALELSGIWSALLEDFDNIEILDRQNKKEISRFRELMETIKHYPPDSDHHLGYYLLEQAGKDWLPFPFMEMLEMLHKEHQKDPKTSTLTKWSHSIDQVIENLKEQLPFQLP